MSFCLYVATFLASNSKCSGDHVFLWGQIVYSVVKNITKKKYTYIYVWVCVISSCILTILLFWVWVSSPAPLRVPAVKCPADVCQFNVTAGEQWGSKQELEASSFMFRSQDMDARGITILYSSGFTLHVVLCNVTAVLPFLCYVVRTRLAPPPRVLKVCHWVKVARAAGRRGVADKKKKGHMGEPTIENIQFSRLTRSHTQQGRSSSDSDVRAWLVLSSLWAAQLLSPPGSESRCELQQQRPTQNSQVWSPVCSWRRLKSWQSSLTLVVGRFIPFSSIGDAWGHRNSQAW